MPLTPAVPEFITVHLGPPSSNAPNVTLPFADYIKNVASSEIYPTWSDAALRANILAQISFALNRVYTEYYRSRGYDFDITNYTGIDQSFVQGREIFSNISEIVDSIFNSYLRLSGNVEPLFAAYCDGVEVQCGGLSQWGSENLARQGYSTIEILRNYYGDNVEIVSDAPIVNSFTSAPAVPLRRGTSGPDVQLLQRRLNRISSNYPAIPKIYPTDGVFGPETEEAVKAFQEIFNLTQDGIVGNSTWYSVQRIYASVKRLSELNTEGIRWEEISTQYPSELKEGDSGIGVRVIQYFLSYVANFVDTVQSTAVDGSFGPSTTASLRSFQRTYGLEQTGVADAVTYQTLYNVYLGLLASLDLSYEPGVIVPFPGQILREGAEGEDVLLLQNYLNFIAATYPAIQTVATTGYFGTQTAQAVRDFQSQFGISGTPGTVNAAVWQAITDIYEDLYVGNIAVRGQYPGYTVGGQ